MIRREVHGPGRGDRLPAEAGNDEPPRAEEEL